MIKGIMTLYVVHVAICMYLEGSITRGLFLLGVILIVTYIAKASVQ